MLLDECTMESVTESQIISEIQKSKLETLTTKTDQCLNDADNRDPEQFQAAATNIMCFCQDIITTIKDLKLQTVKPR